MWEIITGTEENKSIPKGFLVEFHVNKFKIKLKPSKLIVRIEQSVGTKNQQHTQKDNHTPVIFVILDANVLNKILAATKN